MSITTKKKLYRTSAILAAVFLLAAGVAWSGYALAVIFNAETFVNDILMVIGVAFSVFGLIAGIVFVVECCRSRKQDYRNEPEQEPEREIGRR